MKRLLTMTPLALGLALVACGDVQLQPDASTPDSGDDPLVVPATYSFESRFVPGQSSVSYSGQVFRQVLIAELNGYIGRLTADIDSGTFVPEDGQVELALDFYYRFDSTTSGQTPLTITTDPGLAQAVYDDIGAANLTGKIAGNDPVDQHKDWTTEFAGWSEGDAQTPEALVQYWFAKLDDMALDRAAGTIPQGPEGAAITKVYITAQGQDLQQLIQKFLWGAVTLSQGIDDYLDDATEGRGLNSSNLRDGEAAYSALEHAWDEGFGYFGAARDYGDYTDEEIAGAGGRPEYARGYHDSDNDGAIDLRSEYNFGASTNAAKRDLGSAASAPTDFSRAIFDAFLTGRAIIASAEGELSAEQKTALLAQRDIIVQNWEKAISATVVHYINDVLRDMNAFDTVDYNFNNHAKHWSEMKGFALGLQFSPFSPLSGAQFVEMHQLMRDAPVLPGAEAAEIVQYRADLIAARAILAQAYGFDPANVGDDEGKNGW
jgi:hypothetical protein